MQKQNVSVHYETLLWFATPHGPSSPARTPLKTNASNKTTQLPCRIRLTATDSLFDILLLFCLESRNSSQSHTAIPSALDPRGPWNLHIISGEINRHCYRTLQLYAWLAYLEPTTMSCIIPQVRHRIVHAVMGRGWLHSWVSRRLLVGPGLARCGHSISFSISNLPLQWITWETSSFWAMHRPCLVA
jgi:hypothetical protein